MAMLLPDVNILVYAQREEMPQHPPAKEWLTRALDGDEPVGVFEMTLASFVRIVTNRRIFKTPTPISDALAFAEALRASPAAQLVLPQASHWKIFERLCRETPIQGDDVPDAYLAALAIELDAELITTDRGFSRFSNLKWRNPL